MPCIAKNNAFATGEKRWKMCGRELETDISKDTFTCTFCGKQLNAAENTVSYIVKDKKHSCIHCPKCGRRYYGKNGIKNNN